MISIFGKIKKSLASLFFYISDINIKSPYCQNIECEFNENWQPVFPEMNFILLKGQFF